MNKLKRIVVVLTLSTVFATADIPLPPCPGPGCPQSGPTLIGTAIDLVPLLFSASYNWWMKHIYG